MTEATGGFTPPEDVGGNNFESFIKSKFKSVDLVNPGLLRAVVQDDGRTSRKRFAPGKGSDYNESFRCDVKNGVFLSWGQVDTKWGSSLENQLDVFDGGVNTWETPEVGVFQCEYNSSGELEAFRSSAIATSTPEVSYLSSRSIGVRLKDGKYERDVIDNFVLGGSGQAEAGSGSWSFSVDDNSITLLFDEGFSSKFASLTLQKNIDLAGINSMIPQELVDNPKQEGFELDQELEDRLKDKTTADIIGAKIEPRIPKQ